MVIAHQWSAILYFESAASAPDGLSKASRAAPERTMNFPAAASNSRLLKSMVFSSHNLGLMGIVANAASGIPGVLARDDLRERFRFGGIRLVASHAELCGVGKHWFLTGEVLRVASERTMAGFASDIGMRTFAFRGDDVVVAGSAGLVAGKDGSASGDFIEGAGAVMSILAELRRE